jgi:RluA family pseudouridine synthase
VPVTPLKLTIRPQQNGSRLDTALAEWLPRMLGRPVSKAKVRKLIMAGAVDINGRGARSAAIPLSTGMTIYVRVDARRLFADETSRDREFVLTQDQILFEDADLIVVNKPAGLPLHTTADETRKNLAGEVRRFLFERDGAEPYLGVHHRLDRDTSGVVLFTKSQRANAGVSRMFSEHTVLKIYHAITIAPQGGLRKQWNVRNRLGKIGTTSKRARYGAVKSGGQIAETAFRVIEVYPRGVWIEAIPKTGRTHQIRVHLSEGGMPILGDDLYGPEHRSDAPRLMLHARELRFQHPITGEIISVTSPLPADFERTLLEFKLSTGSR